MKFVEIRSTQGERMAVNPTQITHIFQDPSTGTVILTLSTDRRVMTNQFRSIAEAVHWCKNTEYNTSVVGEIR